MSGGVTNKEEGDTYSSYSKATICLLLTVDLLSIYLTCQAYRPRARLFAFKIIANPITYFFFVKIIIDKIVVCSLCN